MASAAAVPAFGPGSQRKPGELGFRRRPAQRTAANLGPGKPSEGPKRFPGLLRGPRGGPEPPGETPGARNPAKGGAWPPEGIPRVFPRLSNFGPGISQTPGFRFPNRRKGKGEPRGSKEGRIAFKAARKAFPGPQTPPGVWGAETARKGNLCFPGNRFRLGLSGGAKLKPFPEGQPGPFRGTGANRPNGKGGPNRPEKGVPERAPSGSSNPAFRVWLSPNPPGKETPPGNWGEGRGPPRVLVGASRKQTPGTGTGGPREFSPPFCGTVFRGCLGHPGAPGNGGSKGGLGDFPGFGENTPKRRKGVPPNKGPNGPGPGGYHGRRVCLGPREPAQPGWPLFGGSAAHRGVGRCPPHVLCGGPPKEGAPKGGGNSVSSFARCTTRGATKVFYYQ